LIQAMSEKSRGCQGLRNTLQVEKLILTGLVLGNQQKRKEICRRLGQELIRLKLISLIKEKDRC